LREAQQPQSKERWKLRIAVFDADITDRHAIGKCQRRFLAALCDVHEFTVFAVEFDNPRPDRIRWVRVPAPRRPLALSFAMFHVAAPICYAWYRLHGGERFDWIQGVEGNLLFGDICYAHFCHRVYLREHGRETRGKGLRGFFNRATNWLQARIEPFVLRKAKIIVVPSRGLARELRAEYAIPESKIRVLPNPVDIARMSPPSGFNRSRARRELGCREEDILISFVALGQYERKGLPLLLEAIASSSKFGNSDVHLVVVGGPDSLVKSYRHRADSLGLNGNIHFTGYRSDVRPYLWAADVFALPSYYEVFPLVALEAAAAGLPLLVARLNGVEEFIRDGENGIVVERNVASIEAALQAFSEISQEERRGWGRRASRDVQCYSGDAFVERWSALYRELESCARS
jgi:glycosyltransferase involved in cell wall biosynthesis